MQQKQCQMQATLFPANPLFSLRRHPEIYEEETGDTLLDSTGMFHWCESVPLEHAVLVGTVHIKTLPDFSSTPFFFLAGLLGC